MEKNLVCSSCKKNIANESGVAIFPCPKCAKTQIIRCRHCRETAVKYRCKECGFNGPN